jgi:hypothetical protein
MTTPGTEAPPPLPPVQPPTLAAQVGGARSVNLTNSTPTVALIFGLLGLFIFPPLGIVAIVLGIMTLRRPTTVGTQRTLAIAGIVTGIFSLVWGSLQLGIFFLTLSPVLG